MLFLLILLQMQNAIEETPKVNSNINVVFVVIFIILISLLGYLFWIDRKITTLEKKG